MSKCRTLNTLAGFLERLLILVVKYAVRRLVAGGGNEWKFGVEVTGANWIHDIASSLESS